MTKLCAICKVVLPLEAFNKCKKLSQGRLNTCRACTKQRYLERYADRARQHGREHYARNRAEMLRKSREYRKSSAYRPDKDKVRDKHLMHAHGITLEQFKALFAAQWSRCALCLTTTPRGKGWHVDHDHKTGKIRGILCQACNMGLGCLGDDPNRLLTAARYLLRDLPCESVARVRREDFARFMEGVLKTDRDSW